ncbi:MAG: putative bifunctional diguanylate cyclase/phosphodiesterase [Steroidobacteraceae bacterium]
MLIQADLDDALAVCNSLLAITDATIEIELLWSCAEGERCLGVDSGETVAGITAIVYNLFLPDTQGIDTVDRLIRAASHVPILLLCNSQHEDVAKLAIQRGAHDYLLTEEINSAALDKSLRGLLGRVASINALFEEKERAQVTLNSIGDAIISVDVRGDVTYLNVMAETLTGWSNTEAVGQPSDMVLQLIDATTRHRVPNPLIAAILMNEAVALPQNNACIRRDGVETAIEDSCTPIHDRHGQLTGAVMVFHDVGVARAQSQRMSHMAHHDGLTDLPYSDLFDDRLTQAMALAYRHGQKLSLIFLDIDRFKHVNDSLGHIQGDLLLKSVTERLLACVRNTDTVSRRGGDEFVILLSEVVKAEDASICAEKILAALSAPHCIGHSMVQVTASMGIATFPDDGIEAESLLRNADAAMYHAKKLGRSRYQLYKPALNAQVVERQAVENDLRRAVAQNEFTLHYQPKIDLNTGDIIGVEALVRWRHPLHGLVLPQAFMVVAEATGLIVPIGRWVLREACQQARYWRDAGLPTLRMAINVSPQELRSDYFITDVCAELLETGMEPSDLEFELTESVLLHDSNQIVATLQALRKLGVHLALDDFGVGRSSLSDLKRLPIDTLILAPSIVRQLGVATEDSDIFANAIGAVIGMSMNMKMRVVGKGIETHQELLFLRSRRCAVGQGLYFSQPLVAPEITKLLEAVVQTQRMLA